MMMDAEVIKQVNDTARYSGATVQNAVVPAIVLKYAKDDDAILDYGAGYEAIHTLDLRDKGYYVTAYDIGNNVNKGIHREDALSWMYDLIFASNVLNVLPKEDLVRSCVAEISATLDDSGVFICNYPYSPRYSGIPFLEIKSILLDYFDEVEDHKESKVFICKKPNV